MADPLTILGAAGLFVAGMTAVANIASAYGQYRANHPRKRKTGRVYNYTANHQGLSLKQYQGPQNAAFYTRYIYMLQPKQQPRNQNYVQSSIAANVASIPTQQSPPRNPSFTQQYFPACSKAVKSMLGRTSTAPQFMLGQHAVRSKSAPPFPSQQHAPSTEHVPRSNSAPFGYHAPGPSPPGYGFGGHLQLTEEQRSRDTFKDTKLGMQTGRMPGYSMEMAHAHWSHFTHNTLVVEGTIAVVNWSERLITMYVYSKPWKQYFRNYHVHYHDLEAFGRSYCRNQVFTGILKESWLIGSNDDLKVVEDDGYCDVKSSNCWSLLGIPGHVPGDLVFVEMKRAALFGLLQCRSKEPTLLNVDMVGDERVQFVHVDSDYRNLDTRGNCWFSVFSFATNGWSEDRVLVG